MIVEIKVPSPGESISEVEIASWLVASGDYVEKDQEIAEIDSDKATLALPSEESGVIELVVGDGEVVQVGQVIAKIDTSAAAPEGASTPKEEKKEAAPNPGPVAEAPKADEKSYAAGTPSPAAKKILDEKGVDPKSVSGTGKGGRITKDDAVKAEASMGSPGLGNRGSERKRMSSLRRKLAQRLVSVKNETAMLTTFNEVDMKPIFDLRAEYKDAFKEKHGVGLGFMSFFTLAMVHALNEFPQVNSMIDGDELVTFDYKDISIAVSGPKGLMVPVIRNAENLSFAGVEKEVKRLAIRVRDGEITVDEMTGGTFTITNGGVFGSMMSTPIINPPQSAILGMHNIVERPVAVDGKVEIRPIMYVALSYDHRVIDGRESVGCLVAMKEALENPAEILMGGDPKKALGL
ncbi:2-oxoglutarate dehydrogenase complex dihydrolipoyllysine-residue succinyltransferase [Phaeocystidibacter marisrubri]|uniref:Dihydrolipoyllysine-residue succinyltransferase component of 2-oxoglutarate dehydrogenase complex n=1 Tax=Phaeocystidibacter marisrubri TaxID=1577780 RepID=A0A6L3ZDA9_9FLAO|nr:2-oxoglutarate dehydrogenase complex dihydrolipoyllysine-residue succinyltransferase [Phaeocystidibacter marisrubri]KAB2815213.1 2-oxoglutarate dehydrogenase complex dihydrolipoyllysine-residue succinyltransferase [Phaeocystidibacter marisrubri]GGH70915.1 dihydrolipoyllysine-residue succinyltransferase component of 2-oxoglutarate dehydrogenase complex [Phaeocystidibacter marisrubri]